MVRSDFYSVLTLPRNKKKKIDQLKTNVKFI